MHGTIYGDVRGETRVQTRTLTNWSMRNVPCCADVEKWIPDLERVAADETVKRGQKS
jgi:hypothetical protein